MLLWECKHATVWTSSVTCTVSRICDPQELERGLLLQAEGSGNGKPPLTLPRKGSRPGNGAQKVPSLPRPQTAKERGGVKFAPQLEIVSEAPARESSAVLSQETSSSALSLQQNAKDSCSELRPAILCALLQASLGISGHDLSMIFSS